MAEGKMASAVAFAAKQLKRDPDTTLVEMKRLGDAEGVSIYPVIMSKARAKLGIKAKRGRRAGSKNKVGRKKTGRRKKVASRRSGGAPRRATSVSSSDPVAAIQELASHMKELESEVKTLRDALAKINDIAGTV